MELKSGTVKTGGLSCPLLVLGRVGNEEDDREGRAVEVGGGGGGAAILAAAGWPEFT